MILLESANNITHCNMEIKRRTISLTEFPATSPNLPKRRLSGSLHVSVEEGENFESGIRCRNIGTCFVSLTPRQYAALKTKFPRKGLDHA